MNAIHIIHGKKQASTVVYFLQMKLNLRDEQMTCESREGHPYYSSTSPEDAIYYLRLSGVSASFAKQFPTILKAIELAYAFGVRDGQRNSAVIEAVE